MKIWPYSVKIWYSLDRMKEILHWLDEYGVTDEFVRFGMISFYPKDDIYAVNIFFQDSDVATMFKLTWGGK